MTRLRALTYCVMSFTLGLFLMYLAVNLAFMWGSVVRGAKLLTEEREFWTSLDNKIDCERNGYKFMPNTHTKEVLVVKRKNKAKQ